MKHPQLFEDDTIHEPNHESQGGKKSTCTPSPVGSGPEGETCGTCDQSVPTASLTGKRFYKCGLMERYWTRGGGSDIKTRWPACRHWVPGAFWERVFALGEFMERMLGNRGLEEIDRTTLLIIADYYEEQGQDMQWLRLGVEGLLESDEIHRS